MKTNQFAAKSAELKRPHESLRQQTMLSQAEFVSTELGLAVNFCKIAESTNDPVRRKRNIANAKKAKSTAKRFLKTKNLPVAVKRELGAKMAALDRSLGSASSAESGDQNRGD